MDKAEAKKEISLLRQKRQNAVDDARITYLEGFIDGQKELEQYAQQVSKPIIEMLKVARCPNCDGDGVLWLNENEIGQCQWCDERNKLIKNQQ